MQKLKQEQQKFSRPLWQWWWWWVFCSIYHTISGILIIEQRLDYNDIWMGNCISKLPYFHWPVSLHSVHGTVPFVFIYLFVCSLVFVACTVKSIIFGSLRVWCCPRPFNTWKWYFSCLFGMLKYPGHITTFHHMIIAWCTMYNISWNKEKWIKFLHPLAITHGNYEQRSSFWKTTSYIAVVIKLVEILWISLVLVGWGTIYKSFSKMIVLEFK